MASIWAPPFLQVVVDKLATLLLQEIGSIFGINDELSKLERTFLRAQTLIDSVQKTHYLSIEAIEAERTCFRHLKEAVDDADDILDEIGRDRSSMRDDEEIRIHMSTVSIISSPTIAHRISYIQKKLDEISKDMDNILLQAGHGGSSLPTRNKLLYQQTTSVLNRSSVYGRETEVIELRQVLKTSSVSIVSLLGMLGIGKTVLAKLVFNDDYVKNHFESRVWVSAAAAAEGFNVKQLAKSIIESATGTPCDLIDLDPLLAKLSEVIVDLNKFLLVFDGVFYEEYNDELDDLLTVLRNGTEGSKILITAQNEILVSKIMGTNYTYRLGVMSDDDCWAVFKGHAFNNRNEDKHPKLVAIGRRFRSKWQGMPLVAKTLGMILRLENDENEWQTILNSEILDLPKDKNVILDSLRLTSYYLPHHLRQCIAYCSLSPCEFEKDRIIELWIAEGLIHSQGKKGMVDIGNDYFNELLVRSFFEYVDHNNPSVYKMPNLTRVLAQYISNGECFRIDDSIDQSSKSHIPISPRHLSLLCANIEFVSGCKFERSRSFLVWCKDGINIKTIPPALFQEMRRLRVLVLSDTSIEDLPNSICNLKYLRYVDLSRTSIKSLPESMSGLDYLHTLKLVGCGRLVKLLKDMKRLIHLQHLHLDIGIHLVSMPPGMGNLTKLQMLSVFLVGKELGCQVGELREMSDLRGSLCISKLENVTTGQEARGAMLNKKQHIQKLELHWSNSEDNSVAQEVLAGLQPHHNLAELQIMYYGGVMFPAWIGSPLFTNMVHISLKNCLSCKCLPPLGQLPSLKFLNLREFHQLKCVDRRFCGDGKGFPALETLEFDGMSILESWDGLAEGDFPLLRQLTITGCPKLLSLPILCWMGCLQCLDISSCNELNGFSEEKFPASLQSLTIVDCPILGDRCLMEEGGDRHKIANISRVEIDFEIIFPIQV